LTPLFEYANMLTTVANVSKRKQNNEAKPLAV
jgi:hypothetical protein